MIKTNTETEVGKLIMQLDADDSGWVACDTLKNALLDLGYPPGHCQEMIDYADVTSDDGLIPILPFFVRLKRSGLLAIPSFRFAIGTRLLVHTGPKEWSAGTIIHVNAREPHWPRDYRVPYQVELENGGLVYVEEDTSMYCRELVPPWWHQFQGPSAADLANASIGQNLNERCYNGIAFLHHAVSKAWLDVVDELIRLQADVDIIDNTHSTPLHQAASMPHAQEMVQTLCAAGALVNCQDLNPAYDPEFKSATFIDHDFEMHRTPLHYSSERGDVSTMRILIQFQADVNIQDGELNTPLHLAIQENMSDAIDVLLQSRADIHLGNLESGLNSPLMCAAHRNEQTLAKKLIEAKANINQQGKSDMTALHLAARSGNAMLARILLSARADIAQKSACGTALDLATKNGKQDVLDVFGIATSQVVHHSMRSQGEVTSVTLMSVSQRAALFMD